jgi:thioredoxin-like negative regulator of GroEL
MKKFFFSGDINAAAVSEHTKAFFAGSLKADLKSEEPVPEDTANAVKVVKGKSFHDIVINNSKDVLIEFYAPWCGHCKK